MPKLESKVTLVTGGASGLGKAIALRLAADGARVIISDIKCDLGEATASTGGLTFLEHDVSDEAQWPQIIQQIEERFERYQLPVDERAHPREVLFELWLGFKIPHDAYPWVSAGSCAGDALASRRRSMCCSDSFMLRKSAASRRTARTTCVCQ